MTTTKTERSSPRPEHQVTGRDYPGEWARRIELYLDEEWSRRRQNRTMVSIARDQTPKGT